jgi:hypothetical protein
MSFPWAITMFMKEEKKMKKKKLLPDIYETRIFPIALRVNEGTDPNILAAVSGSVDKWKNILAGGIDKQNDNCPLCIMFKKGIHCGECPVNEDTGNRCDASPYGEWYEHQGDAHERPMQLYCPECARLAYNELEYLQKMYDDLKCVEVPQNAPTMKYYGGDVLEVDGIKSALVFFKGENAVIGSLTDGCYWGPIEGGVDSVANGFTEEEISKAFSYGKYEVKLITPSKRRES